MLKAVAARLAIHYKQLSNNTRHKPLCSGRPAPNSLLPAARSLKTSRISTAHLKHDDIAHGVKPDHRSSYSAPFQPADCVSRAAEGQTRGHGHVPTAPVASLGYRRGQRRARRVAASHSESRRVTVSHGGRLTPRGIYNLHDSTDC